MYPGRSTAILIDGAFFFKRLFRIEPYFRLSNATLAIEAEQKGAEAAELISRYCRRHCWQKLGRGDDNGHSQREQFPLHRILFYDCPPIEKKMHYPVSGRAIDFSKTPQAIFRKSAHKNLQQQRKLALRLGRLLDTASWRLTEARQSELRKEAAKTPSCEIKAKLSDADFELNIQQKGVDMRIGVDIAHLAYKSMVSQIILIAGDGDFVPAAKLARREGIDIIVDPLNHSSMPADILEHTDGIQSYCQYIPAILAAIQAKADAAQQLN